tara:strand:- start:4396 stop:4818 length:423 start_codon:yes stop_codon:yes gene_type:complete
MKDKNNNHIVNIQDLLEIESVRSKRKHPCDININEEGKLLNDYFSKSKGEFIPLLDMPLSYMVRAFNKTLQELYNLKENREEGKKFKVTLNTDETYSKIVEAQDLEKAREKAYNQFFQKGGDQMKLEDQNIDIIDIQEVK